MISKLVISIIILATFWERVSSFKPVSHRQSYRLYQSSEGSTVEEDSKKRPKFDAEFAEAISKPLPEWYIEAQRQREIQLQEVVKYREQIIRDFKAKYDVSEKEKLKEQRMMLDKYEEKLRTRKSLAKKKKYINNNNDEDEITTKEKWDLFWEKEKKDTGFYWPGFFEVFPELKTLWPKWAKDKNGKTKMCKNDQDCPFPQACCPHPIVPGLSFCCTKGGKRKMVPAYAFQEAKPSKDVPDERKRQKPL